MNNSRNKITICAIVFITILLTTFFFYSRHIEQKRQAVLYLSKTLAKAHIIESVQIHNKKYVVRYGVISDNKMKLTTNEIFIILSLAYSKSIAERSPLFALAGTNLQTFRDNIVHLKVNRAKLSALQSNPLEKTLVYYTLYPFRYLDSILVTEESRRRFLKYGNQNDLRLYNSNLKKIQRAYLLDSFLFEGGFRYLVPSSPKQYITESHQINKENSITTIVSLRKRIENANNALKIRLRCTAGNIQYCSEKDIQLPTVQTTSSPTISKDDVKKMNLTSSYNSLVSQKTNDNKKYTEKERPQRILLDRSFCVSRNVLPLFSTQTIQGYGDIFGVGDTRFIRTNDFKTVPFFSAWKSLGIKYVPSSPMTPYTCLVLNKDIGRIYAIKNVSSLSRKNPLSAFAETTKKRDTLLLLEKELSSPIISEYSARTYVSTGLSMISKKMLPQVIERRVIDLALQINNTSSAMELTLSEVYGGDSSNIYLMRKGIPSDLQSSYLFFVRSGFVLFNMLGNKSFGKDVSIFSTSTVREQDKPYVYLSTLINTRVSMKDIVKSSRLYIDYHKRGTTQRRETQ